MTTETPPPAEVEQRLIKYVYSGVVGFTKGRSAEAQDIIYALGRVTLGSLDEVKVAEDQRIFRAMSSLPLIAATVATHKALALVHR